MKFLSAAAEGWADGFVPTPGVIFEGVNLIGRNPELMFKTLQLPLRCGMETGKIVHYKCVDELGGFFGNVVGYP